MGTLGSLGSLGSLAAALCKQGGSCVKAVGLGKSAVLDKKGGAYVVGVNAQTAQVVTDDKRSLDFGSVTVGKKGGAGALGVNAQAAQVVTAGKLSLATQGLL